MKGYIFYIIGLLFIVCNPLSAQENNGDKEITSDSTESYIDYKIDIYGEPSYSRDSKYEATLRRYYDSIVFSNFIISDTIDETKLKASFYGDEEITMRYFFRPSYSCPGFTPLKFFIDGQWLKNTSDSSGLFYCGCYWWSDTSTLQSANHRRYYGLAKDLLVYFKSLSMGTHVVKIEMGCEKKVTKDGNMIPLATGQFEFIITKDHIPPANKDWSDVMPFETWPSLLKIKERLYHYDNNPDYTFHDTVFQTAVKKYVKKEWRDVDVFAVKSGFWTKVKTDDSLGSESRQVNVFVLVRKNDGLCYVRTVKYYTDKDPKTGEFNTKGYLKKEEQYTEERIDCPSIIKR